MGQAEVLQQSSPEQQHAPSAESRSWPLRDTATVLLLVVWSVAFHGLGLGALEFFRHTEADRTLIAWEMIERGQYLVPHLLGSEILSKPPLFYWLLAEVFQLTGEVTEFSARLASAGIALLFLLAHYAFLRAARCSPGLSLLGAIILSSSVKFFILASVAEIDLTFGFFCSLALYASYLGTRSGKGSWTPAAYLAVALAFLTKGPPVVLLFGVPHVLYFLVRRKQRTQSVSSFLGWNAAGCLLAVCIIGGWLLLLANQVGWPALEAQFRVEIFERIFSESSRSRGPLFYLQSCFALLGQWGMFFLAAIVVCWREKNFVLERWQSIDPVIRELMLFSALVVGSAIVQLSLAEGKSNRYLFPVHSFLTITALGCAYLIHGSKTANWLFQPFAVVFGLVCAVGVLLVPLVLPVPAVAVSTMYKVAVPMAAALLLLAVFARRRNTVGLLACVAAVVFCVRLGQAEIFAPHRNAKKTVKPAVARIEQTLPPAATIYTVEMAERWVVFYLKRQARTVLRLTPHLAEKLAIDGGRVYLLLNEKEESWRLEQLRPGDSELKVLARVNEWNRPLLLVEVAANQLPQLNPRELFPTKPTKPPRNLSFAKE